MNIIDSDKSRIYEQFNNTFELNGDCADVCSVQDSKFNTIFVVAITTYEIATAFYGLLFDTIGTGFTRILRRFFIHSPSGHPFFDFGKVQFVKFLMKNRFKITISETIGLVFLLFVDENNPGFLYPGTILISMSGIMVLGKFQSYW